MTGKAGFSLREGNPDVLTCIANLSNDQVFTPPEFANRMLNTLAEAWAESNDGADIWADPTLRFLDPFTKSGVFLREITARLTDGLDETIPDLRERVEHILTRQIYGIALSRLTSLLARRSVYCSKDAASEHSIARSFDDGAGNIWFEGVEHTWVQGKCKFCGASKATLGREPGLEAHAYEFIHTDNIKAHITKLFGEGMQFDVIIGNPPYQLDTGGVGRQARPIYPEFVEQAKRLDPRFLVMVTPSRWFMGGMGLDSYRSTMLGDDRIQKLVDFVRDKDAFPTVNVNGGVSYFLWNRDFSGNCEVTTVNAGGEVGVPVSRPLNEYDTFVRHNDAVLILRKVLSKGEPSFKEHVSAISPFGFDTKYHGEPARDARHATKLYGSGAVSWISRDHVKKNAAWIDKWKVLVPSASDGNEIYPLPIWDQKGPFVAAPNEVCSWTYLVAYIAQDEAEARNVVAYLRTKFFRFLVSLRKVAQHNKAENFAFVPDLDMDGVWTDEALFERYGFDDSDVAFIDEMIRTMDYPDG